MSEKAFTPGDKVSLIHDPSQPLIVLAHEIVGVGEKVSVTHNVIVGRYANTSESPTFICAIEVLKEYDENDAPTVRFS